MIEIRNLVKSFDGFVAIDGVDMTVDEGSIYGLVGTNGAGKTTILNLLAGVTKPDSGQIDIGGKRVSENPEIKSRISYIPDDLSYYGRYNTDELGSFMSRLYPLWDKALYDDIIATFELNRKTNIKRFSKGMQKQAAFAVALSSLPDYLILDEPIDGLDPLVRRIIWERIVGAAADRGMTTLVSSHNLREMEGFCDSIGILADGKMVLERDLDDLRTDVHKLQISFGSGTDTKPKGAYDSLNVLLEKSSGVVDYLIVRNSTEELDAYRDSKRPVIFEYVPLTLEEVFVFELGGVKSAIDNII